MISSFLMRAAAILLAAGLLLSPASAQDRATVEDFSVHLFLTGKGTLSPDVTRLRNFQTWNFHAMADEFEGGDFHGYLISLRFVSPREMFAKGPQARIELYDRNRGRVVKRLTVSNVYVGVGTPAHRALFVEGLDCTPVRIVVSSHGKQIEKELPFECGE